MIHLLFTFHMLATLYHSWAQVAPHSLLHIVHQSSYPLLHVLSISCLMCFSLHIHCCLHTWYVSVFKHVAVCSVWSLTFLYSCATEFEHLYICAHCCIYLHCTWGLHVAAACLFATVSSLMLFHLCTNSMLSALCTCFGLACLFAYCFVQVGTGFALSIFFAVILYFWMELCTRVGEAVHMCVIYVCTAATRDWQILKIKAVNNENP